MQNPTLLVAWTAHEAWIRDLLWTPCQRYLYTASSDGLVFAWSVPRRSTTSRGTGRGSPWLLRPPPSTTSDRPAGVPRTPRSPRPSPPLPVVVPAPSFVP
ncbi:unnamed protein product [Prorocentrum cordatum]|uniref:Uncharacterized protein n=1 Tax=Prorocentrum cordatum TaxID=2364126 RepID=A0ABN9P8K4_9DINO|nr:unnamed protein product [Polarella glacialis]